jgi:hypothetical protein
MTTWKSLTDVAAEFGVAAGASDPEILRNKLKKIMSSIHPDKNGGEFKTDKDKTQYLRAKEALEFLDSHAQFGSSLIPISQLPALFGAFSKALASQSPRESAVLQSTYLTDARSRIARRFMLPKISSGVFAAITAFLVTFSDKFGKNPILAPLLNGPNSQMILLSLIFYSGMFFVFAWYRERQAEAAAEYLLSESALREIFSSIYRRTEPTDQPQRVNSRQILEAVDDIGGFRYRRGQLSLMIFGSVDLPTIEKATAVQTQRLVERKLLSRVDIASIDTWYEINRDISQEFQSK